MKQFLLHICKNIRCVLKSNGIFLVGILLSSTLLLYGVSLISLPFDKQPQSEAYNLITSNAEKSNLGLSLNSLEIKPRGNSDYWIYSSNALQDFQMRNQHMDDVRSYIFPAYTPSNSGVSFLYKNINCTSILFESKFEQNNFYFNMPLIAGSLPRITNKFTIYVTDVFANKILNNGETYDSLIGRILDGSTIYGGSNESISLKIAGVFDTNNNIGILLKKHFGENVIFLPDYNTFRMAGSLYFCGSTNKEENKAVINFIFSNYKNSYDASRGLETGYNLTYSFYDYVDGSFILSSSNERMNKIISSYQIQPTIYMVIGIVLSCFSIITILISARKNKNMLLCGKGYAIFTYWLICAFSLLVVSLLYKFAPIMALISGTKFTIYSPVTSTIIFVTWILLSLLLSFIPFVKKPK